MVNWDVLILEIEIEELVEWVLDLMLVDKEFKVLDFGIGSGVIGIILVLECFKW